MMMMMTEWALPLCCALSLFSAVESLSPLLRLDPDTEYAYVYDGRAEVGSAGNFSIQSEFVISPYSFHHDLVICELKVNLYRVHSQGQYGSTPAQTSEQDFSKRTLFDINLHGEVKRVYFERNETPTVAALKKGLLSLLSARLHASDSLMKGGSSWKYKINETSHGVGEVPAHYSAERSGEQIVFHRTVNESQVPNAKLSSEKRLNYHGVKGVLEYVEHKDSFDSPTSASEEFDHLHGLPGKRQKEGETKGDEFDVPSMGSKSAGKLRLLNMHKATGRTELSIENMVNDSMDVNKIIVHYLPLQAVEIDVKSNISCLLKEKDLFSQAALSCFKKLVAAVSSLTPEDKLVLAQKYLNESTDTDSKRILVNAFGSEGSNDSFIIIIDMVLKSRKPNGVLILNVLTHFVGLHSRPPQKLLEALTHIVFDNPYNLEDEELSEEVNSRANLVLAAVANHMKQYDPSWSANVVKKMEANLGYNDVFQYRQRRSAIHKLHYTRNVVKKSILLHCLGNAGLDSSFDLLLTYVNDSDTPSLLRRSALRALGKMSNKESADVLFLTALGDQHGHVRRTAAFVYMNHPKRNPQFIFNITNDLWFENKQLVLREVDRIRSKRNVISALGDIWKEFEFHLKIPGKDWRKQIGSKKIGASFGIVIQNEMDLKIRPLSGHFKVDIYDTVYVSAHIGILNLNFHLIKAEVCFRGGIEYNINLIAELDRSELQQALKTFDIAVKRVMETIKNAMNRYKGLKNSVFSNDPAKMFDEFIKEVKNLPLKVSNLRNMTRTMKRKIAAYDDLPPVVNGIKQLITQVIETFNRIKADVMNSYNTIIDAVTITLPWAEEQLKNSVDLMVKAVKKLFKDPKTSVNDFGKGITKISATVTGVLQTYKKIKESLFLTGKKPSWFNIKEILGDINNDIQNVISDLKQTDKWINEGDKLNDPLKHITGLSVRDMRGYVVKDLKGIVDEFMNGPVIHLKGLATPFLKAYDLFDGTVKDVKETFDALKNAYNEAKTLIQKVFGPKVHHLFPRKYLVSTVCGRGFYPSTGNGKYKHKGVDLEIKVGKKLVAPFQGMVKVTDSSQVTITVREVKDMEVIIDNVQLMPGKDGKEVFPGEEIGSVVASSCQEGHIHFSMRKIGTKQYTDSSKYVPKRKMSSPMWRQECDDYVFILLNLVISSGHLTKGQFDKDEELQHSTNPDFSDLPEELTSSEKKKNLTRFQADVNGFLSTLGLPDLSKISSVLKFNFLKMKVKDVLNGLVKLGKTKLKEKIDKIIEELKEKINNEPCERPDALEDAELRSVLKRRGKSDKGTRKQLIKSYLESENKCLGIRNKLKKGMYCRFIENCLGVSCCFDLKLWKFHRSVTVFARFDPCNISLTVGIDAWTKSFKLASMKKSGEVPVKINKLVKNIVMKYDITMTVDQAKVFLKVDIKLCSKNGQCLPSVTVLDNIEIILSACHAVGKRSAVERAISVFQLQRTRRSAMDIIEFLDLDIQSLLKELDIHSFNDIEISKIIDELREAAVDLLKQAIDTAISKLYEEFFKEKDAGLHLKEITFGPEQKTFFEYTYPIPLGPIILTFEFGIGGTFQFDVGVGLSFTDFKVISEVTPQLGAYVSGSVGVTILAFKGELMLTGYLLTVGFPTTAEVGFSKFPLKVGIRMDVQLVPLKLQLHARLLVEINLVFMNITKELISKLLWQYTTPVIRKNIFNIRGTEPDSTPPVFSPYTGSDGSRAATTTKCSVKQVEGRDYTEPAFSIELGVDDDRGGIVLKYSVGSYPGGSDIVKDELLGGTSAVIQQKNFPKGMPLYFTVTATNSNGGSAHSTCHLSTYDASLPIGRISQQFSSSSDNSTFLGSSVVLDDSPILQQRLAVGVGKGSRSIQLTKWEDWTASRTGSVPVSFKYPLRSFAKAKFGKVVAVPTYTTKVQLTHDCAVKCLQQSGLRCVGFNFDHGSSPGHCELLDVIEGHRNELHQTGDFWNYERLGVGLTSQVNYTHLNLLHNQLYYINHFLNNSLGYSSVISSHGMLTDFTSPLPGPLKNIKSDTLVHVPCVSLVLPKWKPKCSNQSPLPNHRIIIDGPGSKTLFNGDQPNNGSFYTRTTEMADANWAGINDPETGLLGYTWAMGQNVCQSDIYPYADPHAHLHHKKEWNNKGVAHPLNLKDGIYYVTVRAFSNIEYGGPMVSTICHTAPYIVDTTPPIFHEISNINYNEQTYDITGFYNFSDPLSGIHEVYFGLGHTKRDTQILSWQKDLDRNRTHFRYSYKLKDGQPSWLRLLGINRVDLHTSAYGPYPLLIDLSPPIAGTVFDGTIHEHDWDYQSDLQNVCASWNGFLDEQSGIQKYQWGVGTLPGTDDIVSFREFGHTNHSSCAAVNLTHNSRYYSTVIAFNQALKPRQVNTTSDGILIDTTQPVKGKAVDGLNPSKDLVYASSPTSVLVNWDNFSDPESGIGSYSVIVYRKHATKGSTVFQEETIHISTVNKNVESMAWHQAHLLHQDYIRVKVTATNNARLSKSASTNGVTIDLTSPVVDYLVDGKDSTEDHKYTSSNTNLSASWNFEDKESGIVEYNAQVFEVHHGSKRQIYPINQEWKTLPPTTLVFTTDQLPPLQNGALYTFRVAATNGAGLQTVHDTNGIMLDTSPPMMDFINVGVYLGESEELLDGYVLVTDNEGIISSWMASDDESGISRYWVAVGTSPGSTDVSNYQDVGLQSNAYLDGLGLNLTNMQTNSPIYYLSVKAENEAGSMSFPKYSSPIKVVPGDTVGLIIDGGIRGKSTIPLSELDVDYQLDSTTISMQFSGFNSDEDGIMFYEWAVGSQPLLDDIQSYTSDGIVLKQSEVVLGPGLPGSGKGHALLPLSHGQKYYVSVRAHTGAKKVLESSSDGVLIDRTPPAVQIRELGPEIIDQTQRTKNTMGPFYQENADSFTARWDENEDKSIIDTTVLFVGTYPGGRDVLPLMLTHKTSSLTAGLVTPAPPGQPNILTIKSKNILGLETILSVPAVTVDATPPEDGRVTCSKFITYKKEIECQWVGFMDPESPITSYRYGLGNTEGDDSVYSFTTVDYDTTKVKITDLVNITLENPKSFIFTVIAKNKIGLETSVYFKSVIVDTTPPKPGKIKVFSELDVRGVISDENNKESLYCKATTNCRDNTFCQVSTTQINVQWMDFEDEESGIMRYDIALGTTSGGAQIKDFQTVADRQTHTIIDNLDLSLIPSVFVTVRGHNGAGKTSIATAHVYISRYTDGLTPLKAFRVSDGNNPSRDIDYQTHNDFVGVNWDFSGDSCPIQETWWSVVGFDGKTLLHWRKAEAGSKSASADGFAFLDGQAFYVLVKAINMLGVSIVMRTDGVTVYLQSLLPGVVRDGSVIGFDLDQQASVTSLSANWDGFGKDFKVAVTQGGVPRKAEGSSQQEVDHYEVAIGTDPNAPGKQSNVHRFADVGLNKTWTFTKLKLFPKTVTYYLTVRAYGVTGSEAVVTSNGIRVGIGGETISNGIIDVPRFISSTTHLSFDWNGFKFSLPVMFYEWGLLTKNGTTLAETFNCSELTQYHQSVQQSKLQLFDIHPLTNADKDTLISATDLTLVHMQEYEVVVIATDESATCQMATATFTVDTTPPEGGHLKIGAFSDLGVTFTDSPRKLRVEWDGFKDEESGISKYIVSLYQGPPCPDTSRINLVKENEDVHALQTDTSCTFYDLKLSNDRSYYVTVKAENFAGKTRSVQSSPILVDTIDPVLGTVIDGNNYRVDREYQFSTTEMEAVFLYQPSPTHSVCPKRDISLDKLSTAWSDVGQFTYGSENIFETSQLVYGSSELLINIQRHPRQMKVITGAVGTGISLDAGGIYSVDIKAASGNLSAVTSILFCECADNEFNDFNIPVEKLRIKETRKNGTKVDGSRVDSTEKHTAFGFQVHPDMRGQHLIVLWATTSNGDPKTMIGSLESDPSEDWHNYELNIIVNKKEEKSMVLSIDGKLMLTLADVPVLGTKAKFMMGVRTRSGEVPKIIDQFNLPRSVASFKRVRFPPLSIDACHFLKPFETGDYAIMKFLGGVGSEKFMDNVVPFTEVSSPCIPCSRSCDVFACSQTCKLTKSQVITAKLSNLTLSPYSAITNGTSSATYFISIKAVSGSGREAIATSNGVTLDVTLPIFQELYHVDMNWSEDEQTMYQGNGHSIAVRWAAYDLESQIVDYEWAIGSSAGNTDVQDYTSVGLKTFAVNSSLAGKLVNNHTYYVTVKATNGAGSSAFNRSAGVTVLLQKPFINNTSGSLLGSMKISRDGSGNEISLSNNTDRIYLTWENLPPNTDSIYFWMGSMENSSDIFPKSLVGGNSPGSIEISNGVLYINSEAIGNMSDFRRQQKGSLHNVGNNDIKFEPGSTLNLHLELCTISHRCNSIKLPKLLVAQKTDVVLVSKGAEKLNSTLKGKNFSVNIQTVTEVQKGDILIIGLLKQTDLEKVYLTQISGETKPNFVNPALTIDSTERILKQRILKRTDVNLYVSTTGRKDFNGSLIITVKMNSTSCDTASKHLLLYWHADSKQWRDSSTTCGMERDYSYDCTTGMLTVMVCETHKSQTDSGEVSKSTQFMVAIVSNNFYNAAPVFLQPFSVEVEEDSANNIFILTASDADDDEFEFFLHLQSNKKLGMAKVFKNGSLLYMPNHNEYGTGILTIRILENRNDPIPPKSTDATITINVLQMPDAPQLFFALNANIYNLTVPEVNVTLIINRDIPSDVEIFQALVIATDVDSNDKLTLKIDADIEGNFTVSPFVTNFTWTTQNCETPVKSRSSQWEKALLDVFKANNNGEVMKPCGLSLPVKPATMAVAVLRYVPKNTFRKNGKVKVVIFDSYNFQTDILTLHINMKSKVFCGNNTLLPDPDDCHHYYQCVFGNPVHRDCPAGLVYNPQIYVCDRTGCTQPDEVTTTKPTSTTGKVVCRSGDFLLPDPDSCYNFYQCVHGRPVLLTCSEGLVFNPEMNTCDTRGCTLTTTTTTAAAAAATPIQHGVNTTTHKPILSTTAAAAAATPIQHGVNTTTHKPILSTTGEGGAHVVCPTPNARIPDPSDCHHFYVCVHGNPVRLDCQGGLVYSVLLMNCVHPGSIYDDSVCR